MQEFSDNLSTLSYVSKRHLPLWFWDSHKGTFLGRTAASWSLCILFYVIYYACLACFFVGMMMVFLYTQIPNDVPARTGSQSILGLRPGLGYRPILDVQKSLISYSTLDEQQYRIYTQNIDAFLKQYHDINVKPQARFAGCNDDGSSPADVNAVCKFELATLGPCQSDPYGYKEGKPCVILKLNKVYGWLPDIESKDSKHVLVNCTGQNPTDTENLRKVKYYPETTVNGTEYGYFDAKYFPYLRQPGYMSPLVAIQFEELPKKAVTLIECGVSNVKNAYDVKLNFEVQLL